MSTKVTLKRNQNDIFTQVGHKKIKEKYLGVRKKLKLLFQKKRKGLKMS